MITGINESKTLTKHIPCDCKYKLDGTKMQFKSMVKQW